MRETDFSSRLKRTIHTSIFLVFRPGGTHCGNRVERRVFSIEIIIGFKSITNFQSHSRRSQRSAASVLKSIPTSVCKCAE